MWKHPLTGHWRATERILGNFLWKILCKNLDLKGGGTGAGEGTLPMYLPPLRSNFLYRIFHKKFPRIRPVAFQWPVILVPVRLPGVDIMTDTTS